MGYRHRTGMIGLAAVLSMPVGAHAFDNSKYPDLKGEWSRVAVSTGGERVIQYDPTKRSGRAQQAPLTAEYQAIFEANLADMRPAARPATRPAICTVAGHAAHHGRLRTDGNRRHAANHLHPDRAHPRQSPHLYRRARLCRGHDVRSDYAGYSIGKWVDKDGDGRYDPLVVETRGLKGPRTYEATGMPLHRDNQSIIRERIYLDKTDPNLLHDEITTIDHALTRPWTVTKKYRRDTIEIADLVAEDVCAEGNIHVGVGREVYFLSADGLLMPAKKDQSPPDLRYFKNMKK